MISKIKTKTQIKQIREELAEMDKKVIFTNGCFDILHRGHVEYLETAKCLGDILIVGLNSDNSVKRIKGKNRPVNNDLDRAFVLSGLESVDYVVIFIEDTPYELIKLIKPDLLVKGGDWKPEEIVGSDIVQASGGEVISLSYREGYSSSLLIKKIKG